MYGKYWVMKCEYEIFKLFIGILNYIDETLGDEKIIELSIIYYGIKSYQIKYVYNELPCHM